MAVSHLPNESVARRKMSFYSKRKSEMERYDPQFWKYMDQDERERFIEDEIRDDRMKKQAKAEKVEKVEQVHVQTSVTPEPNSNWMVSIPKGGHFYIFYETLSLRQRIGMRLIGWGVEAIGNDK